MFSIPGVQTYVARQITKNINETREVDIRIGEVGISYFGNLALEDVLILDHHQDTLIFSEEVRTSLGSLKNLLNNNPHLGNTTALDFEMNLKVYEGERRDNLNIFLNKLKTKKNSKDKSPFILTARRLEVLDSRFSYINENLNNPEILIFDDLNIYAEDFLVDGSDVYADIEKLTGFEDRGIEIDFFSTSFAYTSEALELSNLKLETANSSIAADIALDIREGFGDFENAVPLKAVFRPSVISTDDLQAFYDKFSPGHQFRFSSVLEGTLNNFEAQDLQLEGMDRSLVEGDFQLEESFGSDDFSLEGQNVHIATNYYDLVNLLPGLLQSKLPQELSSLGNVEMNGDIYVSEDVLETDAIFESQLGLVDLNMEMTNIAEPGLTTYVGELVVEDFNVGKLLELEQLGATSFDIVFDGKGFTAETLNTDVRGVISKLVYNSYAYNNLKVKGTLRAPVFNGNLISLDPNLRLEFNGLADFSKATNVYDFEANVAFADLHALNFVKRDSLSEFKGDIIMNIEGTDINNAVGELMLLNTSYKNSKETYFFRDLSLSSSFDGPVRTIEVLSPDVINGTVEGIFDITEVPALVENAVGSLYTNYRPNKITTDQYLDFNFDIYNKIVEVFFPKVTLAPNTFIRGSVKSDESEFRLAFKSPEIKAFGNMMQQVNVQVDNSNPLFNTFIEVDSVATDFYNVSDFNLINVTMNDTLFIRSEFKGGPRNDDVYNLNMYHTINEENNSVVGFQNSDIRFKESIWHLNAEQDRSNRIIFEKGLTDIRVDSVALTHENEKILLSGEVRDSTYKDLQLKFDQVDLYKVTPEIEKLSLGGVVDGSLHLLQNKGAYYPSSSLTVKDLKVNDQLLGNLNLDVMGNEDLSFYNINTTLRNEGLESLSAIGEIQVDKEYPVINLDVDLENFKLGAFSALGEDVITNIRGLVSGDAFVTGDYRNPDITGSLRLQDAGLSIPYLEVDYEFEEGAVVNLSDQQFEFDDIGITDTKYGTTGILEGTISHQNFSKWILGLNVSTDRLLVLDTELEEDALYYGTGFIGGNASIYGPTSELVIDVVGTTRSGTVFKIPINETETIGDNSFIHFLSPEEKAARLAGEEIEIEEVKGLELNFDLDVTSDALVEINIDGSILRGKGAGTLLIEINTLGKFNMWGDFIVNTGEYIFNYGALQKRFLVKPGGSINWSGNPALADLNISAVYEAHANPAVILDNPAVSRSIPVDVLIHLQGELLQPEISFDLEYPNVASTVRSELEYKVGTTTNAEMQAFSLLALGQFYTPDVLGGNAGSAIVGGVFQSASSGIFNNLLSDDSSVFQVGLNYEQGARTPEQTTADRFGVTLSTQISDRVLINGQVGVPVGGVTETVIVGNLEIEFLLNEEGNLRAKIFNRENNIQYIGEELGFTQGVGLSYQVDFNTFKELVQKIVYDEVVTAMVQPLPATEEEAPERKSLAPAYIRFPGVEEE